MPMVYAYGRHSTDKQGLTEDAQRHKVEGYIAAQLSDHHYGGWLYDSAVSGSKPLFERPSGRNLWALAQPGDHLVWAKLDRAFRSVVDGAATLAMLAQKGVFVHSLDLGLDTSTAIGRCVCTVMLAFAELEREYARERTREALREKRSAGLPYGRHTPIGWRRVGKRGLGRFVPDLEERLQVARIRELRQAGLSFERIVLDLRGVVRPRGRAWNCETARLAVMADEAGFPKRYLGRPRLQPVLGASVRCGAPPQGS